MSLKELRNIYKDIECKVCTDKTDPITLEKFDNDSNIFLYMDQKGVKCFCYLIESLYYWVYGTTDSGIDFTNFVNVKDPLMGNPIPYDTLLRLYREYKFLYPPRNYTYNGVKFSKKELEHMISELSAYSDQVLAAKDILKEELEFNDGDENSEDVVKMKAIIGWIKHNNLI